MLPIPIAPLLANWKLALGLALVAALGVQTFRLQAALHERALLEIERQERFARDAQRAREDLRNKERTDEEYAAASRRAAAAVVREHQPGVVAAAPAARGGDEPAACIGRGQIDRELAAVARLHAEGATRAAREAEAVAAAFRACRAWALTAAQAAPPRPGMPEPGQAGPGVARPGMNGQPGR